MARADLNVLLLTRYSELQPSSRYRFYQFLPRLKQLGVSCTVARLLGPWYTEDMYSGRPRRMAPIAAAYLRRLVRLLGSFRFDVLWLEGELWPRLPAWGETVLSAAGIPYVVDYDDAIFHRYDLHRNGLYRTMLGKKIDTVMRRATTVVVANRYVGERAANAGATRIEYVPDAVDIDRFRPAAPTGRPDVTIGWIGTGTSAAYLPAVTPALEVVCRTNRARVVLVGSGPVELGEVPVEVRQWTEADEVAEIQSFDVGIMPLPDDPITRGKSGLKLIQYMACARPPVASPVGMNAELVRHGETGFLATSTAEWVRYLTELVRDAALRHRLGAAGRLEVERDHSLQAAGERLAEVLTDAAAHGRSTRRRSSVPAEDHP